MCYIEGSFSYLNSSCLLSTISHPPSHTPVFTDQSIVQEELHSVTEVWVSLLVKVLDLI